MIDGLSLFLSSLSTGRFVSGQRGLIKKEHSNDSQNPASETNSRVILHCWEQLAESWNYGFPIETTVPYQMINRGNDGSKTSIIFQARVFLYILERWAGEDRAVFWRFPCQDAAGCSRCSRERRLKVVSPCITIDVENFPRKKKTLNEP